MIPNPEEFEELRKFIQHEIDQSSLEEFITKYRVWETDDPGYRPENSQAPAHPEIKG